MCCINIKISYLEKLFLNYCILSYYLSKAGSDFLSLNCRPKDNNNGIRFSNVTTSATNIPSSIISSISFINSAKNLFIFKTIFSN